MNDVQRFTPFTIRMLWPSVARGGITRVQAAFTIETKSDSERHRIPHQSRCEPRPPLIACATSSPTVSETGISRIGDEGAEAVHRYRPLIFDSVAALGVFLFPFFVHVGPGGHTNPHGHLHFSFSGVWVVKGGRSGRAAQVLSQLVAGRPGRG
jgi:hypothetical protein